MSVPGLRREDFPALDRLTYLNTASAGLVPASVITPAHEFEFELAQAGTTGMDEDTEVGILEDARQGAAGLRSEEHTSELQSHLNLVCRLLLEKKKKTTINKTKTDTNKRREQ